MSGDRTRHSRHRFGHGSAAVVAIAVLAATLAVPGLAGAGNWAGITAQGSNPCSPNAGINRMDGGTTKVMYKNLESWTELAVNETVWATYDPTNLGMVVVTSGFDVQARDWDYTNFCGYTWSSGSGGVIGLYNCFRLKLSGVYQNGCDKARIRFDTSYLNANLSSFQRTALACHELGHAVGLKHRDGDCMETPVPMPTKSLGSHNVNHLNSNYVEP